MIDFNKIRIPEETQLRDNIVETLQGEGVAELIKLAGSNSIETYEKTIAEIEQHFFRVTETSSPKYFQLFMHVINELGYKEPINFYIEANPEPNAYVFLSPTPKIPHTIVVHSATLQHFKESEICQIVGHEIGHLIIKQGEIAPLLNMFHEQIESNYSLRYKVRLWQQLSELTADRFGFLAYPDIYTHISSNMKLASGMQPEELLDDYNIDYAKMLESYEQTIEHYAKAYGVTDNSHPMTAIRAKAIEIFSKSCFATTKGKDAEWLNSETSNLIQVLYNVAEDSMQELKAYFYASAGLYIASADGQINQDELDMIYNKLANYQIFPRQFFEYIAQQNYKKIFEESIQKITSEDPENDSLKEQIFNSLIQISFADQNIHKEEVKVIIDAAHNFLGYSRKQAANFFLDAIHHHFMPNAEDIF